MISIVLRLISIRLLTMILDIWKKMTTKHMEENVQIHDVGVIKFTIFHKGETSNGNLMYIEGAWLIMFHIQIPNHLVYQYQGI